MSASAAPPPDGVLRAVTDDGSFRVIAATTTETTRGVLAAQRAEPEIARPFGNLVTGTLLIREAMAPGLRVQGIVRGAGGKGSLVADSHPSGTSRGLLLRSAGKAPELGRGALLQMMRSLPNGSVHQGVIEMPTSGEIAEGLMTYMQESEQIVSVIKVVTVVGAEGVVAAGGYIVELLPEARRGPLMVLTERLAAFPPLEELLAADTTAEGLVAELLYGMPYTETGRSDLAYGCQCSELRLIESLATLPRADIEDLVADDKPLEIKCEYCGRDYALAPDRLRALLTTS